MEHNFKKKFGQNFISDKNLLQAIVDDAAITDKDNVLEIGAGGGSLTAALSKRAKRVVSYEIDDDLKEHLLSLNLENVEFVFADVLKEKIEDIEKRFACQQYKIVANLPYYITTPLIFKFLEEGSGVTSLTIMVQKEVAQRIVAAPGNKDYGVLSVMVNFYGDAKITRIVGRQMFYPSPKVDSAVVNITKTRNFDKKNAKNMSNFIKTCFSMRRKTLLNNLSNGLKMPKAKLQEKLANFNLNLRAEDFSLSQFLQMYNLLYRDK